MPLSKGIALLLLTLVATHSAAIGSSGAEKSPRQRSERIAVLLDLEGGQASIGRPAMNGFLLALQQGGGLDPVVFASPIDTKTDPETTESAARAIATKVTMAAGFTDNDSVLIAGPYFQKVRVPFLSIGATSPTLPDVVGAQVFLTPFGDNTQAAAGAEFAEAELGDSVAILWDSTSQYTRTLPRYFRTRFEDLGGQVLLDESYAGGCDLTSLGGVVDALFPSPDFVYLAGLPDCVGEVVASLRAAGVEQPILGGDGLDTPTLLATSEGPTSDVWFTTHAWLSEASGTSEAKAFIAAYREAYGAEPADAFAALGYDAARLTLDVLRRARGPGDVYGALERTSGFQGVTGEISFSADSHVPLKTVWVIEVQDGEKSLADAFVPDEVPAPILDAP